MSETASVRMLVVEDDRALSEILCDELRARGHMAVAALTVAEGLESLKHSDFEVALLDLMLPDGSGIDVLKKVAEEQLPMECIILTGFATVDTAISAMKLGAYDYVTKPARMEELEVLVLKAAEKSRLRRENEALRIRLQRQDPVQGLITEDPAMRELMATVERVAASDLPVLVHGESGTGKELIARALHSRSPRAAQAVRGHQLRGHARDPPRERALRPREGRLHRRGHRASRAASSWPTAARSSSTRSARSPPPMQVKLLRVLQERRVRARRRHRSDAQSTSASSPRRNRDLEDGDRRRAASARTSTIASTS